MANPSKLTSIFQGLIITLIIVFVLDTAESVILPFIFAVFLSFILEPIVNLLIKLKLPRTLSVIITIFFTFLVLYLIGMVIYASAKSFSSNDFYETRLKEILKSISFNLEQILGSSVNLNMENVDWFKTFKDIPITQSLLSGVGSFFSFLWNTILVIIFVVYLLVGKTNLYSKIERAFSKEKSKKVIRVFNNIISQTQTYLNTKSLVSLITAILSLIVFKIFGLDFAIIWAFLIFVFNFIPNFGSFIASVLPITIALIQFDSPWSVLWLAILTIGIQFAIGNILEPRLMGRTLNLSPLMVIVFLIFWGWIWGIAGMLLAVPILGTITIIFENIESTKFISVFLRGDQKVKYY
jgi:AI-2 transport protein TqsA